MIQRFIRTPIMHRAVLANGLVFLGGIVADDRMADMGNQTRQILAAVEKYLAEAGAGRNDIVSATIYTTELSAKGQINAAWTEWFDADHLPARATVGVRDLGPGVLIEVSIIAAIQEARRS